jgi:hypothetical protein
LYACATVGLAELSSANVVGYQDIATPAGARLLTPTFENVGGGKYNLQNLVANNADNLGDATIQVMDIKTGMFGDVYYWWPADPSDPVTYPAGWFSGSGAELPAVELNPGEAIFFSTKKAGVSLTASGQVTQSASANIPIGSSLIGNFTPSKCNLSDVMLGGTPVKDLVVTIQVLNPTTGSFSDVYYWWNADPSDPLTYPAGWFSGSGADLDEVELNPGDSVFINCPVEGVTLNFPKVL